MQVKNIVYSRRFAQDLKNLSKEIIVSVIEKEKIFKNNPLHPSLRLHGLQGKLNGLWSISISGSYRIIFERKVDGGIFFITIGKHDIYKNL
ncbi:MAG: type II toxin-antitoxin system mRNA interferase toxin, RelE/StbE family [Candidatus Uhrbacteria bacterium]